MRHIMLLFQAIIFGLILTFSAAAQENIVLQPSSDDAHWAGLSYGADLHASVANRRLLQNIQIELIRYQSTGQLTFPISLYTDPNGAQLWAHDIQPAPAVVGTNLVDGFYIIGETGNVDISRLVVIRVTNAGAVVWARVHGVPAGTTQQEHGVAGQTMSNGDIVVVGAINKNLSGIKPTYAARFSSAGVLAWGNYYAAGGCTGTINNILLPFEVCQDNTPSTTVPSTGDGVAITGFQQDASDAAGNQSPGSPFILALNGDGTVRFLNTYGTLLNGVATNNEAGYDIIQNIANNNFAVAGRINMANTAGGSTNAPLVFSTNSAGTLLWKKQLTIANSAGTADNAYARAIIRHKTITNAYVIAGPNFSKGQTFALQTTGNATAGSTWARHYTNSGADADNFESLTYAGVGYLLTTNTPQNTTGNRDAMIELLDLTGLPKQCPVTNAIVTAIASTGKLAISKCITADQAWVTYNPIVSEIEAGQNYCGDQVPPCDISVSLTASATQIPCGQSVTINANAVPGPATYLWSTGATTPTINPSPVITTTYCVTVTGGTPAASCTASSCITIFVAPCPDTCHITVSLAASSIQIGCGQPVSITANALPAGPVTYLWDTGATTATINPAPLVTTTYCVTVTGGTTAGVICTATACITIFVAPCPCDISVSLAASATQIGCGQPVTITATAVPGPVLSYLWSTGATTASINPSSLVTTTYCVTVTGGTATGLTCTATACITIIVNCPCDLAATVVASAQQICAGTPVTLTTNANMAPVSYLWSTGGTTQTITVAPLVTTTYCVTVTSLTTPNCTTKVCVTVNVVPCPCNLTVSALPIGLVCGSTATIPAVTNGPATYLWSNGQTGSSLIVTPLATTTYCVTVTSTTNPNCTSSTCVTIYVDCPCTVSIDATCKAICKGESTTLTAMPGSASTYLWSNGATTQTITVSPLVTTTYCVTATSISNPNCQAVSCYTVYVIDCTPPCTLSIITDISTPSICKGQNAILYATPTQPATLLWSNGATTSPLTVTPTATTTYCVTATSIANPNCTATACITVTVLPCAPVTGVTISSIGCYSFVASWTTNPCLVKSRVQYRKCGVALWSNLPFTTGVSSGVSGLACGTCYQVRIQSLCADGTYVYSSIINTATAACTTLCINPNLMIPTTEGDASLNPEILVYPNPTRDIMKVDLTNLVAEPVTLTLRNIQGQVIQNLSSEGGQTMELDMRDLPDGTYFLQVQNQNVQQQVKIMKQG
jgi:Secretion system C-terminal sorting domain